MERIHSRNSGAALLMLFSASVFHSPKVSIAVIDRFFRDTHAWAHRSRDKIFFKTISSGITR